jgi:hypothetical protein
MNIRATAWLLFATLVVHAQSTNTPMPSPPTTNWVTAVPWFREVNGRLYNTEKSDKFIAISADCEEVLTNGVVARWIKTKPTYRRYSYGGVREGNFLSGGTETVKTGEEIVFDKEIFVQNYPLQGVAEGQKLNFRAMEVGVTNYGSHTIELWDYGTPHRVTVVSTNSAPMKASVLQNRQFYHVVAGDTLTKIAEQYGTTVKSIEAANNLPNARIHIGQTLVIPNP